MSRIQEYLAKSHTSDEPVVAQETWIDLPDMSIADIHSAMETQVALECLEDQLNRTTEIASLEGYDWAYKAITQLSELAPTEYPALESHDDLDGRRAALVESVGSHHNELGNAIDLALEDYTTTFGGSLKKTLDTFSESQKKLKEAKTFETPDGMVRVNHSRIWAMMHVDDKMISHPSEQIRKEQQALEHLIQHAEKAMGAIDPKKGHDNNAAVEKAMNQGPKTQLMFNTTVVFKNGRAVFDAKKPPAPKREKTGRDYARGALKGAAVGFLFFGIGSAPGAAFGGLASKATGDRVVVGDRDVKEVKDLIEGLEKTAELRSSIEGIAAKLDHLVGEAGENKATVKRQAAPIMELLGQVSKHIAELLHGGGRLADMVD